MAYIPVTQLRKDRKKKRLLIQRKMLFRSSVIITGIFCVLLFPVLSQSFIAYESVVLAVCILLLFSGILIGLTIQLLKRCSLWLRARKQVLKKIKKAQDELASEKQKEFMVSDKPRLRKSFFHGLESLFSICVWAFFLNLVQPFITTILWWQGYKLMEGNAFSLATIERTLLMIESAVYFGILVFLILFSWSRWNYWRCGQFSLPSENSVYFFPKK